MSATAAAQASGEPMIKLTKLNKWYGDFHVLKNIDFEVRKGEKIVVCGPSGSGKSTMIRCINRLEEHQQGTLVVDGIELTNDPVAAVQDARCVVTDAWVSMSDERQGRAPQRHNLLAPYQLNAALLAQAAPDAIVMHCLPAHRGEEITDEVMDGPQSVVFDEAENRLHAQKGVLLGALGAG